MMPTPLFAMISRPNMPSIIDPVASTMSNRTPRIALIRVNTFALMMSLTERLARSGTSLVCPAATRSATWAAVKPFSTWAGSVSSVPIAPPSAMGSWYVMRERLFLYPRACIREPGSSQRRPPLFLRRRAQHVDALSGHRYHRGRARVPRRRPQPHDRLRPGVKRQVERGPVHRDQQSAGPVARIEVGVRVHGLLRVHVDVRPPRIVGTDRKQCQVEGSVSVAEVRKPRGVAGITAEERRPLRPAQDPGSPERGVAGEPAAREMPGLRARQP